MADAIGLGREIRDAETGLDESYHGGTYGIRDAQTLEAMRTGARLQAMITDPVFEGMSIAGVRWYIIPVVPDRLAASARSANMARVRSADTKPELLVRKYLHARGFRYRLHTRSLPGKPDLTFANRRVVVFVHGCFWHQHDGCRRATIPKTHTEFWRAKLHANVSRDHAQLARLKSAGWRVLIVWGCRLDSASLARLANELEGDGAELATDCRPLDVPSSN